MISLTLTSCSLPLVSQIAGFIIWRSKQQANSSRPHSRADPEQQVPHIVIYNPTNSPMSFGANSSQTVTYNNQSVKEIIPELLELITAVHQLEFPTKDDVIGELTKVQALAHGEMNDGKWQLIQSRLVTAKTALDIAQVVAHSIRYWPAVWSFFFK